MTEDEAALSTTVREYHQACQVGDTEAIQRLIDRGMYVDARSSIGGLLPGVTALHVSVLHRRTDSVELLLQNGAQLDEVDCQGYTPLAYACELGHLDMVELLIDSGADLNFSSPHPHRQGHQLTPLMVSVLHNSPAQCEVLLRAHANPDEATLSTSALFIAAAHGHSECITLLLKASADANQCMWDSHSMTTWSSPDVCLRTLAYRPRERPPPYRPNEVPRNYRWRSALYVACVFGHLDIVQQLIRAGADVNFPGVCTVSVSQYHLDVVQALIDGGLDRQLLTRYYRSQLVEARQLNLQEYKRIQLQQMLLRLYLGGANVKQVVWLQFYAPPSDQTVLKALGTVELAFDPHDLGNPEGGQEKVEPDVAAELSGPRPPAPNTDGSPAPAATACGREPVPANSAAADVRAFVDSFMHIPNVPCILYQLETVLTLPWSPSHHIFFPTAFHDRTTIVLRLFARRDLQSIAAPLLSPDVVFSLLHFMQSVPNFFINPAEADALRPATASKQPGFMSTLKAKWTKFNNKDS
eukprot:NODE_570_length_1801_cov_100.212664_g561_i0.p1 GENE.NODE_570_length_1801_cov_100.212664_g561_i0~~NODE_570_length_1801_cov_100.212664_g561_i0.p1  ORF type:complete len:525 (+),score=48.72 NODE_570_length_1801_cov_100.212664_g561_i0:67-1641(+)